MTYVPITDAELTDGKPLKSDILARLRDNPQERICSPPGSMNLNLRPSAFVMDETHTDDYRDAIQVKVSDTATDGEACVMFLDMVWNNGSGVATPRIREWTSGGFVAKLPTVLRAIYSGGAPASVRISKRTDPTIQTGTGSGPLSTLAWLDIPLTDTWTTVYTMTVGGQNPTAQVKAFVSGTSIRVQGRLSGAFSSGRLYFTYAGYIAHIEYKAP